MPKHPLNVIAVGALLIAVASPTLADPCEAPVKGYRYGQTITAQVRYVGDADSLCISPSSDPASWLEIRVADFYGPELHAPGGEAGKRTLERLIRGKQLTCRVGGNNRRTTSYDRVLATCYLNGVSIGDLMRRAGVQEGGRGR